MLIPEADERERFLAALRAVALRVASLTAALATQWLHDGSAAALLAGVRAEAQVWRRMARDVLAGRYEGAGDGLQLCLDLPAYWTSYQLARAAAREGLVVTPAQAFAAGEKSRHAIRISVGTFQDRRRLQAGLQRLSRLLARKPDSFGDAIVQC